MTARYCPRCGAALGMLDIEGQRRARCVGCGRIHYAQLKVGAGALVEREESLLLLQRAHAPFQGCWNIPAGYVEADEHPAQAVVREVREETGLEVTVERLVDVYFFDDDPRGNGILLVYWCQVVGGDMRESPESTSAIFFAKDDLPAALAGGAHDQAILSWQRDTHTSPHDPGSPVKLVPQVPQ